MLVVHDWMELMVRLDGRIAPRIHLSPVKVGIRDTALPPAGGGQWQSTS